MVGVVKNRYYWHDIVGYNYRMTNICAAIGLGQLKKAKIILKKKREVYRLYKLFLNDLSIKMNTEQKNSRSSFWLINIFLKDKKSRDNLARYLKANKVETRNTFNPVHLMPMHKKKNNHKKFINAQHLSNTGLSLPSGPSLKMSEIRNICNLIRNYLGKNNSIKTLP